MTRGKAIGTAGGIAVYDGEAFHSGVMTALRPALNLRDRAAMLGPRPENRGPASGQPPNPQCRAPISAPATSSKTRRRQPASQLPDSWFLGGRERSR